MKPHIGKLASAAACAAALVGGSTFAHTAHATPNKAAKAATAHVSIKGFAFHAKRLVVKQGTRVTWKNSDSDPHTVKSAKGHFASEALDTGDTYSVVMRHTGTFSYICTIHPNMHGEIVVRR
jgi:plastocyanin